MELRVRMGPVEGWSDEMRIYSDGARIKSCMVRPDGTEYLVSESNARDIWLKTSQMPDAIKRRLVCASQPPQPRWRACLRWLGRRLGMSPTEAA